MAVGSLFMKLSSLLFFCSIAIAPIIQELIYKNKINIEFIEKYLKSQIITIFLILLWFIRGLIQSGCLFYPISITCFDVPWIYTGEAMVMSDLITAWARQPKTNFESIGNFNWILPWYLKNHAYIKSLSVIFLIVLLVFNISKDKNGNYKKERIASIIFFVFFILSSSIWFFYAPDFRFFSANFLGVIFVTSIYFNSNLFSKIYEKFLSNKYMKYLAIFIIPLLLYNKVHSNYHVEYSPNFLNNIQYQPREGNFYGVKNATGAQACYLRKDCYPGGIIRVIDNKLKVYGDLELKSYILWYSIAY